MKGDGDQDVIAYATDDNGSSKGIIGGRKPASFSKHVGGKVGMLVPVTCKTLMTHEV